MKKYSAWLLCFVLCACLLLCACDTSNDQNPNEQGTSDSGGAQEPLSIPCTLSFSSEADLAGLENVSGFCVEPISISTVDAEGNNIDPDRCVLKPVRSTEQVPVAPGRGINGLCIGESDWAGYSVTFDVWIKESGKMNFVIYDETNVTDAPEWTDGSQQKYWWCLFGDGKLYLDTTMGKGDYFKEEDGSDLIVKTLRTDAWNRIEIKNCDDALILFVNGSEIVTLRELDGTERGQFVFSGFEMAKDMQVTRAE